MGSNIGNINNRVRSHIAAARKLGMDDEVLGELLSTVAVFSDTSRLAAGYQLDLEEVFLPSADV